MLSIFYIHHQHYFCLQVMACYEEIHLLLVLLPAYIIINGICLSELSVSESTSIACTIYMCRPPTYVLPTESGLLVPII